MPTSPDDAERQRRARRLVTVLACALWVVAVGLYTLARTVVAEAGFFALMAAAAAGVLTIWAIIGWIFFFTARSENR